MDSQKLLNLKKCIENKSAECDEVRGRIKQLKEELKREFDCESVADAKKLHNEISDKIVELDKKQEVLFNELETKVAEFQC